MKIKIFTFLAVAIAATSSVFAQLEIVTGTDTVTSQIYLQFEDTDIIPADVTGVTSVDGTDSIYIKSTKTTVGQEANKIVADGDENVLWMDYDGRLRMDSTLLNKEHFSFSCDLKWNGDNNVWYMGFFGFTGLNMDRTVITDGDTTVTPGYAAKQFQMGTPASLKLTGMEAVTSATFPAKETWAHLVFTYDTGDVKIYIDSTLVGQSSGQTLHAFNEVELHLGIKATVDVSTGIVTGGEDGNGNSKETQMYLDNVALFDVALSSEQVTKVYEAARGITSSIDETKVNIGVYPNPVVNVLTFSNTNVASVAIYSLSGQLQNNTTVQNSQVDMSQMTSGLYMVRAFDLQGNLMNTVKIMKK